MNGELAQAVALVAHGNAALASGDDLDAMEKSNSTFQYVRSVAFEVERRLLGTTMDSSVRHWMKALHRTPVGRLSLIAGDAAPTAFANQGMRGVLGHGRSRTFAWYGSWEVNRDRVDPADPKPRLWEVTYRLSAQDGKLEVGSPDVPATASRLQQAIGDARVFADAHNLTPFDAWFKEALAMAGSPNPEPPYHPDMLPQSGYSLDARQLLAMATRSWVFGGMGSWNDVGFTDSDVQAEYEEITTRLYRAVVDGIRVATNSFA